MSIYPNIYSVLGMTAIVAIIFLGIKNFMVSLTKSKRRRVASSSLMSESQIANFNKKIERLGREINYGIIGLCVSIILMPVFFATDPNTWEDIKKQEAQQKEILRQFFEGEEVALYSDYEKKITNPLLNLISIGEVFNQEATKYLNEKGFRGEELQTELSKLWEARKKITVQLPLEK